MNNKTWQYILKHHMGRWHLANTVAFREASRLSKCRIKIYSSCEPDYIWLVAVDKGKSYKEFWLQYRLLCRK